MTQQLVNVLVGLSTALIGYLIGRLWQTLVVWRRYRKARRFWRPVVGGRFQVVVSRFEVAGFREPTGVVGGGDAIAHRLLVDVFHKIGLERPEFVYVDEPELDLTRDLILLGGPDTNRVTKEALSMVKPGLSIVNPGPGLAVQVQDSAEIVELGSNGANEEIQRVFVAEPSIERMTDYGILIRSLNPFDPTRALVVIGGAYGYGAWAGVRLSQSNEFLRRCEVLDAMHPSSIRSESGQRRSGPIDLWRALIGIVRRPGWAELECLFKVEVLDGRPQAPQILRFRALSDNQTEERGSSVPRNGTDRR